MRNVVKYFSFTLIAGTLLIPAASCRKGPGPGGQCSISGKVFAYVVNNVGQTHYVIDTFYYAGAENVYCSYGDEPGAGDIVKTAEDGSYLFDYLLPGKYKIYAVSRDTSNKLNNAKRIVSLIEVEITGRREQIVLEDLVIVE